MKKIIYSAPVAELEEVVNAWCFLAESGTGAESLDGLTYQDLGDIWSN